MRVAVITNIIAPYKSPLFQELSRRLKGDLLVVYETAMESNRRWTPESSLAFENIVLPSFSIDLRRLVSDLYVHVPWRPLAPLRRFMPDVVIAGGGAWTSPANIAALTARKHYGWRFVPWWGSFDRPWQSGARRTLDPIASWFVRAGDAWIAFGSKARDQLIRYGADPQRITIAREIPGRNMAQEWLGAREKRNGNAPPRYLFVGQLIERKGLRVLLSAFDDIPNGELWIAGDGEMLPEVQDAVARNPRIRYLGHRSTPELHEFYGKADVLVLPSLYEVWGIVVNEALMHGLPVVTTSQVGAAADLIEPGVNGIMIRPGNAAELAAAMVTVASWPSSQLSRVARVNAMKTDAWSIDRAADGILAACDLAARMEIF
jgi:glycosyltransferase involved in cell wall biosynthesis